MPLSPVQRSEEKGITHERYVQQETQLGRGLEPPSSWSPFPCIDPKIYGRAESLKSPGPGAIYLTFVRNAVTVAVWRCALPLSSNHVRIIYGSRSESVR
jgi:hypothetical protein